MDVRAADESDIGNLARLRAAWRDQPPTDDFVAAFDAWFRQEKNSRWWWLAVDGTEPVGMVNVKVFDRMPSPDRQPSRWGYLANLYVVPDRRGAGAGAALLTAVLDRARAEGLVRIVLSPSEMSVPLYGRHGFRPAQELLIRSLADEP